MKTEQHLADKDADEHRREMNEKRAAEEREAERRRKEEEEKARKAEEDFKRNRKKYENEEALITARVQKEELEVEEESSTEEITALDLQQVTTSDNEKVSVSRTVTYSLSRPGLYMCAQSVNQPMGWGHYAMMFVVCPSVSPSVPCLTQPSVWLGHSKIKTGMKEVIRDPI